MFWYNVISNNPSYYFKMYISEIKKKKGPVSKYRGMGGLGLQHVN